MSSAAGLSTPRGTRAARPMPILERFAAVVRARPDRTAVVADDRTISYAELDERSNQLARYLRARGIGVETPVGLASTRTHDDLVALLGILKSGAGYVPVEPSWPAQRIRLILETASVRWVVAAGTDVLGDGALGSRARVVDLSVRDIGREQTAPLPVVGDGDSLGYIMFTSGSSGVPKGAVMERRSLDALVDWYLEESRSPVGARALAFSSLAWDTSTAEILPALCSGGSVVFAAARHRQDPRQLLTLLHEAAVERMLLPPQILHHVAALGAAEPAAPPALVDVASGGELLVCDGPLRRWLERLDGVVLQNHYGPTETQLATAYATRDLGAFTGTVPIGRPVGRTLLYLLDEHGAPVPDGEVGEVHLGGPGLARGYLGDPALTAERFIPCPADPTVRVYRTGDRARVGPDGHLRFQGRTDDQVKVRGYRIEPGEVEAALGTHPGVARAAVVAAADAQGTRQLVGFVVPTRDGPGAATVSPTALRSYLRDRLPDHLVPRWYPVVDRLPLTANGKVDRKALAEFAAGVGTPDGDTAPAGTGEADTIRGIWRAVLGVPRVLDGDDFFSDLGGDSIAAMTAALRCTRHGVRMSAADITAHRRIDRLLAATRAAGWGPTRDPAYVDGQWFPLLPMQRMALTQATGDRNHWDQAMVFRVPAGIDVSALETAARQVTRVHDALRLRLSYDDGPATTSARQRVAAHEPARLLRVFPAAPERCAEAVRDAARELRAAMRLRTGPVVQFAYLDLGPDTDGRLVIVVHQYAFDLVSWTVLLEDLQRSYEAARRGADPVVEAPTDPVHRWIHALAEAARDGVFTVEVPHWTAQVRPVPPIPREPGSGSGPVNSGDDFAQTTVVLDRPLTATLLHDLRPARRLRPVELLFATLAGTLFDWTAADSIRVDVRGHGRDGGAVGLDVSRTIGWFTSVYPVRVTVPDGPDAWSDAARIAALLRAVPHGGVGYGALRDFGPAELTAPLREAPNADVAFDYHGRRWTPEPAGVLLGAAPEPTGSPVAAGWERPHLIEVVSWVEDRRLCVEWTYNRVVHQPETVQGLAEGHLARIGALLRDITGGADT